MAVAVVVILTVTYNESMEGAQTNEQIGTAQGGTDFVSQREQSCLTPVLMVKSTFFFNAL